MAYYIVRNKCNCFAIYCGFVDDPVCRALGLATKSVVATVVSVPNVKVM
jgi:hypothetical protein